MTGLARHQLREGDGGLCRWYWVTDGLVSLVLLKSDPPFAGGHIPREFLSAHLAGGVTECRFLSCGNCTMLTVGLHEIVPEEGWVQGRELEQPEKFWRKLEETFEAKVRGRRSLTS